jgi:DNA-directed RNA polymerase specialized sigma24 family protein
MSEFLTVFHNARRVRYLKYCVTRGFKPEDAEEVVDNAFLILHRKGSEFEGCPNPDAYAFTILKGAVERLPERQAECVRLRYHVGLTSPEIARMLEISNSTVDNHLAQGYRKLREDLAGYGTHSSQEADAR